MKKSSLEITSIDETKLDESSPDQPFKIDGHQFPPLTRDRDKHGGGNVVFVKEGLIVNRIKEIEQINQEK